MSDFGVKELMRSKEENRILTSRIDAMKLRSEIELQKLKVNDTVRVRIIAVGVKHIVADLYGKEVIIKAENLQHTYIVKCKDFYFPRSVSKGKSFSHRY